MASEKIKFPKLSPAYFQMTLFSDEDLSEVFEAIHVKEGFYHVPNRTGSGWFHRAMRRADAILFGRGEQTVLIAFGAKFSGILQGYKHLGLYVGLSRELPSDENQVPPDGD